MGASTDHLVFASYNRVRFGLAQINKNNGVKLLQWIAFHVLSVFAQDICVCP